MDIGNEKGQSNFTGNQANAAMAGQPEHIATGISNSVKQPGNWVTHDESTSGNSKNKNNPVQNEDKNAKEDKTG